MILDTPRYLCGMSQFQLSLISTFINLRPNIRMIMGEIENSQIKVAGFHVEKYGNSLFKLGAVVRIFVRSFKTISSGGTHMFAT